jgi:hypothetical protein
MMQSGGPMVQRRQPSQRREAPTVPPLDSSHLVPLTELKSGKYKGFEGGLYPGGGNSRPEDHEAAGLNLAREIVPLDKSGNPSPEGRIVLLSIGFSNSTMEFRDFKRVADNDPGKNPRLLIVDGAQGGMDAQRIHNANDNSTGTRFWGIVDQRLAAADADPRQVEVVWMKEINAQPKEEFVEYAKKLETMLGEIVRLLKQKFPNLKALYLTSRSYGGYSQEPGSPEPYAYESAFAVKWLIKDQLDGKPELNYDLKKGAVKAPWLSWGPYIWANGDQKRGDGLFYVRDDYRADGKHPTPSGLVKTTDQMMRFFKNDNTTKLWFLRN